MELDENCHKIFFILIINKKIRFNDLLRELSKNKIKMSKPTLTLHLNHLVEKEILVRRQEGKQIVTYEINYEKLKTLEDTKNFHDRIATQLKNEKIFKSQSIEDQTISIYGALVLDQLYSLKFLILNTIEPENALDHNLAYTIARDYLTVFSSWLVDTCKESKENSIKALEIIDSTIDKMSVAVFK